MKNNVPVAGWLLLVEVILVFAMPTMLLLIATVVALKYIAGGYTDPGVESWLLAVLVIGGYLGIVGIINQLILLCQKKARPLGWTTFLFTLIGCLAAIPYALLVLGPGNILNIAMGLAPICVAIQLTFMNRMQLLALFKSRKGL